MVTLADKRRTAQEASAAVRRQKKALAVCVPITSLFSDIQSDGLSTPVTVCITPVTRLSGEQEILWRALWEKLLSGEEG